MSIKIYKDTPTAGGTDGTLVSSGDNSEPIESGSLLVPASDYTEGSWIKLAARCDAGFVTEESESKHATISIIDSANVDKWQLAPDNAGSPGTPETYGDPLDITTQIDATNTIFWVRARVASTESPANDTSVSIRVTAVIAAA